VHRTRQACALVAGVVLCRWIFIPVSLALSITLWLKVVPREHALFSLVTDLLFSAIAFCVSGFLTGLIVSLPSANREIRTAMLTSLLVIAWNVITVTPIELLGDTFSIAWLLLVLEHVVCAMCLFGFTIMGAWLVVRKRRAGSTTDNSPGRALLGASKRA